MELLWKNPGNVMVIFLGLILAIRAIPNFSERKRVVSLAFGVLLVGLGLVDLLGFTTLSQKWVLAYSSAIWGLFFCIMGVGTLHSPSRNWATWGALVIGIGGIVMAFVIILVPPPQ